MKNTTESNSHYDHLEEADTITLLGYINQEDKKVAIAVEECIPQISALVEKIVPRMKQGGRLFYMGAGTSGRLGIVDASECPPTYGVPHDWVIGIIAGGDQAIRFPVEGAEDNKEQGWKDLLSFHPNELDTVIGVAASGRTPYVIGALEQARKNGLLTGCITCNELSPVTEIAEFPIVPVVGPEVITGSTRMKSGTAQKLVLNMISTSIMVGLGRVKGNKMVDMQLTNEKLVIRGTKMVQDQTGLSFEESQQWLNEYGSVRKAVDAYFQKHA
jgi:N-acetylmuramic acid 6-phosphate etherase